VGHLLEEIRLRGESAELRDEVTELARKYGIVTPYTAYLIVEDEARRGIPLTMQSLQQLQTDRDSRTVAAENWSDFRRQESGDRAVAGASYNMALNTAAQAGGRGGGGYGGGSVGNQLALRALQAPAASAGVSPTASPVAKSMDRLAEYSQQTQFVNGKNFFQNGNQWIDPAVQQNQNAKRVRIQFNSTEYFALAAQQPKVLPWLALGQNVQFVVDNTVYDIYE
jgi:Ca-activated chloride channel homolog